MPRARQRRTLDTGPRLDINELIRAGLRSGTFKALITVDGSPIVGRSNPDSHPNALHGRPIARAGSGASFASGRLIRVNPNQSTA
jgi:hypothetical protein